MQDLLHFFDGRVVDDEARTGWPFWLGLFELFRTLAAGNLLFPCALLGVPQLKGSLVLLHVDLVLRQGERLKVIQGRHNRIDAWALQQSRPADDRSPKVRCYYPTVVVL